MKERYLMKCRIVLLLMLVLVGAVANAKPFEYGYAPNGFKYVKHAHSESAYQHAYCSANKGVEEYELKDKTRVDCLTETHAIEFDFSNKGYESVGQALHYGIMTGKKPKVVLILDGKNWKEQLVYFNRIRNIGEQYNFDVEYITDEILNLKDSKCPYIDCKCHKVK